MKLLRKKIFARTLLVFLSLNLLNNCFYPTISWALTSGPSQPEVFGSQPVDATDNVNLVTGGFNYTIPITSIPEYPMAIGYNSGIGMDQEASCFGLGFNGFSGAVGRNLIGAPDDASGQSKYYSFNNTSTWDVNGTINTNAASFTAGYNNITGAYGSIGLSLTASIDIYKIITISASFSAQNDSRYGTSESVGFGASVLYGAVGYNVTKSLNSSRVDQVLSVAGAPVYTCTDGEFPAYKPASNSYLAPLASLSPTSKGFGLDIQSFEYKQFKFMSGDVTKQVFGYTYLNGYDRENRDHIPDMTIEGENSFSDDDRNVPIYLQKDVFQVNCQGLNGSMQFVSNEQGVLSRNYGRNQYRDIGLTGLHTDRKEVFPWERTRKSSFNKEVDLLQLLKRPQTEGGNDFDNQVFIEEDKTESFARTTQQAELRFRGDLAGDLNMSSNSWSDYQPNEYQTYDAPGAGDGKRLFLFGFEDKMPMYGVKVTDNDNYSRPTIEKSNKVTYIPGAGGFMASINVLKADGTTYLFNTTVTAKNESYMMSGRGKNPPIKVDNGNDYNSSNKQTIRKVKISDGYEYPYAWLLGEIRGQDYIDFDNIPGPSDGDLGYWVKFDYTDERTYNWREPFVGMNHNMIEIHDPSNDVYSVQKGTKKIRYLKSIESSDYVAHYLYEDREDGFESNGAWVIGDAKSNYFNNELKPNDASILSNDKGQGSNSLKKCTEVRLFKKHPNGENSKPINGVTLSDIFGSRTVYGKPTRATTFTYNYELCGQTFNNRNYGTGSNTGKLTLKKVQHTAFDDLGNTTLLPSYNFDYAHTTLGDAKYNPDYDRKALDSWGNYSARAKSSVATASGNIDYYNDFVELDKSVADISASAFHLTNVSMPTGGSMRVNYEAGGYGKVQTQTPYALRRLKMGANVNQILVDVTDLPDTELPNYFKKDSVFMAHVNYFVDQNRKFPDRTFLAKNSVKISSVATSGVLNPDGRKYLTLDLIDNKPLEDLKTYIYEQSSLMRALKANTANVQDPCPLEEDQNKYAGYEQMSPTDAIKSLASNYASYVVANKDAWFSRYTGCFGTMGASNLEHNSYLVTPIYKEKYTGTRVKSVEFSDNFRYSSNDNTQLTYGSDNNSTHTTNYFYDSSGDGTGWSTGVATIEPGGGISCVVDLLNKKGVGFMPAPSIMYSKVTVDNGYRKLLKNQITTADKAVVSREKGRNVYEFYTAQDVPFDEQFKMSDIKPEHRTRGTFYIFPLLTWYIIRFTILKKKFRIKLPYIVPLWVFWGRKDYYHTHSYGFTDMSDLMGRPKKISQLSSSGSNVGSQEFKYYGQYEPVSVYNKTQQFTAPLLMKPGRVDQAWSESYYTKESDITLIPLFMKANTARHFSFTNMKYTYVPPVLKEVIVTSPTDGKSTTRYTGYDYLSGEALEVSNDDSYSNTKIDRTTPAYWKYADMETKNILDADYSHFQYLGDASNANNNVLSASVTQWSKDGFSYVPGIRIKEVTDDNNTRTYVYEIISAATLNTNYQAKNVYRPIRNYVYKTDVLDNNTGVFNITGTAFNSTSSTQPDPNWRLVSENTLYHHTGDVAEVKDILGKFASSYIGYNFSHNTASIANASYYSSVHEGAENVYNTSSVGNSPIYITDNANIDLQNAVAVAKDCPRFSPTTLKYSDLTLASKTPYLLDIYSLTNNIVRNTELGKLRILFTNGITRIYSILVDDQGQVRLTSNRGESFTGFYVLGPQSQVMKRTTSVKEQFTLAFDPNYVLLANTTITPTVTTDLTFFPYTKALIGCDVPDKVYNLPIGDCLGEVHTGNYCFALPNGNGSKFTIDNVGGVKMIATEMKRKYTAMVWVHKSSPAGVLNDQTKLIIKWTPTTGTALQSTATIGTPYMQAGNWKMLRAEIDLTTLSSLDGKLEAYIQNSSANGLVYYDDFRVQPSTSSMEASVYDHAFDRMSAKLNKENIATWYDYDVRGRMKQARSEVENLGPITVKKYLFHDQKKPE